MKEGLVRFGVAMEHSLLEQLDAVVADRGATRSEVLRDLVRAEVVRARVAKSVPAVATLTLVYDHHVRELTERLTDFQHKLGERVRSTLHVHLDEHRCLEVIVLRGRSNELKRLADRLLATRGVTHGGIEIVADDGEAPEPPGPRTHAHDHGPRPHRHGLARARGPRARRV